MVFAEGFENESAARVTRDGENEKPSRKWERMPDRQSNDKQHRCPQSFENLRRNTLVPNAIVSWEINAEPISRHASRAASIQQTTDTREDHSDENRQHTNIPERT